MLKRFLSCNLGRLYGRHDSYDSLQRRILEPRQTQWVGSFWQISDVSIFHVVEMHLQGELKLFLTG